MRSPNFVHHIAAARATRRALALVLALGALLLAPAHSVQAEDWNNISMLKSRRADVERVLGTPLREQPGEQGTLHFKVAGGTVTVMFVTTRFVANKKLDRALEGTVLQVVLQHENSTDTPESLGLKDKRNFVREEGAGGTIYRNLKDGIVYTFIDGRLRTTRYTPTASQLTRARKG